MFNSTPSQKYLQDQNSPVQNTNILSKINYLTDRVKNIQHQASEEK
jgi:hypothetical protein